MSKAVKLADIAEKLGVSTVTVSKALSGQKGVSEEMREKIRQLADEMGYIKSVPAPKASNQKSYTFGVVVAERFVNGDETFYWQLYQEVSKSAMRKNCFVMFEVINYEGEKLQQLPKMVVEEKIDALIIMGTFRMEYIQFIRRNVYFPIVFLDTMDPASSCDSVVSDNVMGAYRMTSYLFAQGHRSIGFVGTRLATSSIDDRYLGYIKAAMEHGMEVRKEWLIDDRDRETGHMDYEKNFILPREMPTAFFCNCDIAANMLIQKLTECGYSIPEDISVVGFDNFAGGSYYKIGLTTFALNLREMGCRTVHILRHKLENPGYSTGVYLVAGKFIERESVRTVGPPVAFA